MTGLHQRAGLKHSAALTWLELAIIRDSRIPFFSQDGFWHTTSSHAASASCSSVACASPTSLAWGQESFPKRGSFEVADLEANAARVGARSFGAARFHAHRNREDDSSL